MGVSATTEGTIAVVSCRVVSARKLLLRTDLKIVEIVMQNLHFAFSSLKWSRSMGIELWLWSSSLADHGGRLRGDTNSPSLRLLEGYNGGISGVELNCG